MQMRLTVTPNTLATKSSVRSSFCAPLVPKNKYQRLKCASSPSGVEAQPVVWSSHVSRNPNLTSAVEEAVKNALSAAEISKSLAANSTPVPLKITPSQYAAAVQADTALVFCSSAFHEQYQDIIEQLVKAVPSLTTIVGCSGFGVIGGAQSSAEEVEDEPGLSITLAHFPGAEVRVVHISMKDLPDADSPPERWSQLVGAPLHNPLPLSQVILADPSFLRIQELLEGLDYAYPDATKIGGLSSSSNQRPKRALFCWEKPCESEEFQSTSDGADVVPNAFQHSVYDSGAVVMSILGGVSMDLIVAQGCRPLSDITWTVERVDREFNTILALRRDGPAGSSSDGKQAAAFTGETVPLMALQMELQGVASSKEQLWSILNNLTLGVAPDTLSLQPKDFLIRPMSITKEGSLAVGEYVRVGQRIRFMIRDQQGAREHLQSHGIAYKKRQLVASLAGQGQEEPVGMMVFSCNGRGSSLYQEPSYDTRTVSSFIPVPCSGFLCNGEIGGLRGTTHLHGFTCVVGVIRAANQAPALTPVEETIDTKEAANTDITEFKSSE